MPRDRKPASPPDPLAGSSDVAMQRVLYFLRGRPPESIEDADAIVAEMLDSPLEMPAPAAPLDRAQALVYDAWEAPSPKRRIALAREALTISADCADAYLVLAEEAANVAEAHALAVEAGDAGRRAIADGIDQLVEEQAMWLALETRPYLRALAMLASIEWEMGDRQSALARGWELLRLNPGDNQGMRYVQLLRLMHAGSLSDIDRLLSLHPEDGMAAWTFGRALHLFRSRGPGDDANAALSAAKRSNRHVVPYLLGERDLPSESPEFIGFGDESEAAAYVLDAIALWDDTPGAIAWLASRRGTSKARARKRRG